MFVRAAVCGLKSRNYHNTFDCQHEHELTTMISFTLVLSLIAVLLSCWLFRFAKHISVLETSLNGKTKDTESRLKRRKLGIVIFTHSNSRYLIDSALELYNLGYYVMLPYPNYKYMTDHHLFKNNTDEFENAHYEYVQVNGKSKRIHLKGIHVANHLIVLSIM